MIAALTVAVFQYWDSTSQSVAAAEQAGWTQTEWGPLGPADRDLLIKVRQAGLWEGPTGQQAQQQASSARVREVGGLLAAEHADLDQQVRDTSARLGVLLPNQPSTQQQAWMAEIAAKSGSDYDKTFVQLLRAAHGKVLPLVAGVRSGTQNELVRAFATSAAEFVTRHHEYLESTGLVDFSALPGPPVPDAAPPAGAVPPAAAAAPVAPVGAGAGGHDQHVNPVAQASQAQVTQTGSVSGANVMVAALVYIASLLAIVGLLALLGTAGLKARRSRNRPRRAATASRCSASTAQHAGPATGPPSTAQNDVATTTQHAVTAGGNVVTTPRNDTVTAVRHAVPAPRKNTASAVRHAVPTPRDNAVSATANNAVTAPRRVMPVSQNEVTAPRGLPSRPRHAAQRW